MGNIISTITKISSTSFNHTVDVDTAVQRVFIPVTTATLSAASTISATGTPHTHQTIEFFYGGGLVTDVAGGKHCTIFGTQLTDAQALYQAKITAVWNGSAWLVHFCSDEEDGSVTFDGGNIVGESISTDKIADDAITLDKMASIAQGSIIAGGVSNNPTALDASTSGGFMVGDGTDVNVVTMSGDATMDSTGALTIAAGAVTDSMLENTPQTYSTALVTLTSAQIVDMCVSLGGTNVELIAAPGAGRLIVPISIVSYMDFNTTAYTGGGTLNFTYAAAGTAVATMAAGLVTGSADTYGMATIATPTLTSGFNLPLYVENATASFATGDSTIQFELLYYIADFN
jgi:hypothetical protein